VRVLFVTHNVPRVEGDAAGSFVLRLAVALQARGARVSIIAPGAPGLAEHDCVESIPIHRVKYAAENAMTLAYTGRMVEEVRRSWHARFALVGLLRALRRAARDELAEAQRRNEPYDVLHAHWWFPAGLALWGAGFGRERGRPTLGTVVTMHGSDVRLAQSLAPARALMRRVLASFGARTAVSSWLASAAERAAGLLVAVAPMPVDTSTFGRAASAKRAGVLFVGRLNAQKGLSDLLAALAHPAMSTDTLAGITLDVVGDGTDREALHALAGSLGLAARVRWHGALPQAELVPRYQQAAVVVMPSREEGLGLVAVEAQLCGAPVVAYASGGLVDVVRKDAGGTLVPPGDISALATAIASLLLDPALAAAKADAAGKAVRDTFSPAAVADRYLQIYRDSQSGIGAGASGAWP